MYWMFAVPVAILSYLELTRYDNDKVGVGERMFFMLLSIVSGICWPLTLAFLIEDYSDVNR